MTTAMPCPDITTPAPCPLPEQAVDFCVEAPCDNNGTCYNGTDTYFCKCVGLWEGVNCSEGNLLHFTKSN